MIWFAVESIALVATGFARDAAADAVFLLAFLIPMFGSGVPRQDGMEAATRPRPV